MTGGPVRLRPLVIVGPTASGKSALALALAERVTGAEIVSADAMAVYRGMDIGTAKPSAHEQSGVPHHLIDVADPDQEFTLSTFSAEVRIVLDDLRQRAAPAILVGGTGLYVRAVIDDFEIPGQFPEIRAELDAETDTGELWRRLSDLDPAAATKMEPTNRRRILRALEVCLGSGMPFSSFGPGVDAYPETPFVQIGLEIDRDVMDRRIDARYDQQVAEGFLDEVRSIADTTGFSRTAGQALGYRELLTHLEGSITIDEAVAEAKRRTHRFARRQQRWFRRDPRILWLDALDPGLADAALRHWQSASIDT